MWKRRRIKVVVKAITRHVVLNILELSAKLPTEINSMKASALRVFKPRNSVKDSN